MEGSLTWLPKTILVTAMSRCCQSAFYLFFYLFTLLHVYEIVHFTYWLHSSLHLLTNLLLKYSIISPCCNSTWLLGQFEPTWDELNRMLLISPPKQWPCSFYSLLLQKQLHSQSREHLSSPSFPFRLHVGVSVLHSFPLFQAWSDFL